MSPRNLYLALLVGAFLAIHAGMAGYYFYRSRRIARTGWEGLLTKLIQTNKQSISLVALELVDEQGEPRESEEGAGLEPAQLWSLIGGLEGLQVLEKNSLVLIELAFHLQQWYPEAVVVAERLRLDARELQWHVSRLRGAAGTGNLQISYPFYARRAVCTYYRMTQQVLRLYELSDFSMLPELQRAL